MNYLKNKLVVFFTVFDVCTHYECLGSAEEFNYLKK